MRTFYTFRQNVFRINYYIAVYILKKRKMREILSNRKWKLIMLDIGSDMRSIMVDLESIYKCDEQGADYEYNYAIQDEIDMLLDMKVNDTIFFTFNRDDENDKGLIIRVS